MVSYTLNIMRFISGLYERCVGFFVVIILCCRLLTDVWLLAVVHEWVCCRVKGLRKLQKSTFLCLLWEM